jgi:hypothetical protein
MASQIWEGIKRGWQVWVRLAHKIGNFQARVLLTVLYGVIVLPFGLAVRWFGDPLRIKRRPTGWLNRADETHDMKWAQRQ